MNRKKFFKSLTIGIGSIIVGKGVDIIPDITLKSGIDRAS